MFGSPSYFYPLARAGSTVALTLRVCFPSHALAHSLIAPPDYGTTIEIDYDYVTNRGDPVAVETQYGTSCVDVETTPSPSPRPTTTTPRPTSSSFSSIFIPSPTPQPSPIPIGKLSPPFWSRFHNKQLTRLLCRTKRHHVDFVQRQPHRLAGQHRSRTQVHEDGGDCGRRRCWSPVPSRRSWCAVLLQVESGRCRKERTSRSSWRREGCKATRSCASFEWEICSPAHVFHLVRTSMERKAVAEEGLRAPSMPRDTGT